MRKIIEVISNSSNKIDLDLSKYTIKKVWTIYDNDLLWNSYNKFNPITGEKLEHKNEISIDDLILIHRNGVFLEEQGHDWRIDGDNFRYYSRIVGNNEKVKVLIEYTE